MKTSPRRGLEVFDFVAEDEHSESVQGKYLGKFKNPSYDKIPILKYQCLETVSQEVKLQRKDISSLPCVDVDAINRDRCCDKAISPSRLGTMEGNLGTKKEYMALDADLQAKCLSHEAHSDLKLDSHGLGSFLSEPKRRCSNATLPSGISQLHGAFAVSPSSKGPVDLMSDADESQSDSSSSPASEMEEDDVYFGHFSDNLEMDNINMTVVLHPDYVVYRDSYCTEPRLTFSQSGIKISGSTSEHHGTLNFEWGIDELIRVECQPFQKAEFVMIKLRLISKVAHEEDDADGNSGIVELKIAVVEPYWSQHQERIASLNVKYMNAWVVLEDMDIEDDSLGSRHHFPNFDEPFEEVVYPKGDADAVSISKRDVDLLQPETFVNDTIIDFYIKYLKNRIQPEEKHRFHFFNSFFFRKLADLDKDPSSISDGRAAFQRVRKWTRKVDLFAKDYIFIPINYNLHWSLIVICHPGEVPGLSDGDSGKSIKVPCILHMDSIKGSHTGLKNLVQSYLWEEWKERKKETSEDISSKFHNLRFVPLELPQQENSFDCGLFLLHYLELFLAEAPLYFSPFKVTKFSSFLTADWFLPSEASLKRTLIQRLIFELLENRHREVSSAASSDEGQAKFAECNGHEARLQSFSGRSCPAITCQENVSSCQAGKGIEITLLSTSSHRSSECVNDAGLVLRDLFEPVTSAGSVYGQYQSFDEKSSFFGLNGTIPPIEEDNEPGEQFTFLPTGDSAFQEITGMASQSCGLPYTPTACGAETSYDLGISAQAEKGNIDSSPQTSCASDHSEDIAIIENHPVGVDLGQSQREEMDVNSCPSMENATCLSEALVSASGNQHASIIECYQDHDTVHDGNVNGASLDNGMVHGGNGKEAFQDTDKPQGGNRNRGSQNHDRVHGDSEMEESQDPDKMPDGNKNDGSRDHEAMGSGSENAGSRDHDKVLDGIENGSSREHEEELVHEEYAEGSVDDCMLLDGNGNGGSQDRNKVHDDNENEGCRDHDKVCDGNESERSCDHDELHGNNKNGSSEDHEMVPIGNENITSQDHGNENGADAPIHGSSCQGNTDIPMHQDSDVIVSCDNIQMLDDSPVPELQVKEAAKRLRDTPPLEQDSEMADHKTVPHDDVQFGDGLMDESQDQAAKRLRLTAGLGPDSDMVDNRTISSDDVQILADVRVPESHEQQAVEGLLHTTSS